ncbi:pro-opiomelanocortin [Austrofundulus limnaeus]|uniref:Pro-opiomelanocortin n=1 Tax=Austrofundulus limnaeus TaxID=52670 RepID=A0A2I4BXT2_AUSLI|nr:PREDICTED: pro-opiomelanocortin-like [Austrofundulus limnaeus]
MRPVLLLVAAAVVGVARGAHSHCWEHPSCLELHSEGSMKECLQLCQSDLHKMAAVLASAHLQPLPSSDPLSVLPSSTSTPQARRSYSMEHFRWGKPLGRKRRPIKILPGNGAEEESAELFPGEARRRELSRETAAVEDEEKVAKEEAEKLSNELHDRKDAPYKMKHFRWGGRPMASKRYGGFMKSWDEHSQRPLLTLFKNVINKEE